MNACEIDQVRFTCTSQRNASDVVVKNGTNTKLTVSGLKAFTRYNCTARIMNKAGPKDTALFSPESEETVFESEAKSEFRD